METLKLLVIDDEPGIRSGVTRILRNHTVSYPFMDDDFSFDLFEAATGEEGIEITEQENPDIILLDNKLPGIQGTEVLEYLKEKRKDIVVAMITSYASLEIAVKATGDGAYDFIPKPFTPQELKSSVDHIAKQLFLRRITRNMQKEGKRIRYQFLSVLSHELKSPLNAVEGFLRLMQEKQAGDRIEDYMQMIDQALNRVNSMRTLIMDLLDFTKIRLEKKEEKIKEFDLVPLVKLSISTHQPYAIQKNIRIKLQSPESLIVKADPEDMESVFNNLISNAVKYNKEEGTVDIVIESKEEQLYLEVKDSGIGMTDEEKDQLFKEFFRIKNEKTRHITGSGLGLSIVKKLVDIYGGTINVDSVPDAGSTFIITIPQSV